MFKSKLEHEQPENNEARRCLQNEFNKVSKNNSHVVFLILMIDFRFAFMTFSFTRPSTLVYNSQLKWIVIGMPHTSEIRMYGYI